MPDGSIIKLTPQKTYLLAKVVSEKVGAREADVIEADVKSVIAASKWKILMDLADVAMLASMGLGMLVNLHKQCAANGGKLVVCSVRPDILEVLRITHLQRVLKIVDTPEAAAKLLA
jgi:anti-sigma B factor antagonist